MRFAEAYESSAPPARLGSVRLRYEELLLVGEPVRPLRPLGPSALFAAGVGTSVGAVAALLFPGKDHPGLFTGLALALLVCSAALLFLSASRERRHRQGTKFVVNFDTLTLRLDDANRLGQPRTRLLPFDAVEAVEVLEGDRGWLSLQVRAREGFGDPPELALVENVPPAQRADLERLGRVLAGAFGLGEKPTAAPKHDQPR